MSSISETKTTCPYCGVGCGVVVQHRDNQVIKVKGDKQHPANLGRLCSKGSALGETLGLEERLLYPEINGKRVSWNTALDTVASKLKQVIAEHGKDAVAFYVSGQLLTEDYYVANKLMKGFIGSGNIDTNSRLCMSSAVVAHKRAFGEDCVPCSYEDLEKANLIVLTGSNTAWCHPVIFQRISKAKQQNSELKIIVIDPRETQTCSIADLHLALKPGTDAFLFNGLLRYLMENSAIDHDFIEQSTKGFSKALEACHSLNLKKVAEICQLPLEQLQQFYHWFSQTEKVVTLFSQGINQSSSGVDKGNAIINCHLATGRIGKEGMGAFSITGQPNAMGGREVGGLSNQLAAHMDINKVEHRHRVQRFWQSPLMAEGEGLKAVDLFKAIDSGKIKAVWIMATNPVVSLPDANEVKAALQKCETVIVSDTNTQTDTIALANIRLPALAWGEKGGTVTNSDRHISRQRTFLNKPGEAKPDWWIIAEVAKRMGYTDGFNYADSADVFREHAQLSGFENNQERCFDISALQNITKADYSNWQPKQWPIKPDQTGTSRLFEDGKFFHADRKAHFIAVKAQLPKSKPSKHFPLILNTGRIRDQWHSMTRSGVSPKLTRHITEPYVEIHPNDAKRYKLEDGDLAHVSNKQGEIVVRAQHSPAQQIGSVFIPIHWNDQFSANARVDSLIPSHVDPYSGQPESKHAVVKIQKYQPKWVGFVLSRRQIILPIAHYWTRSQSDHAWQYDIAGDADIHNWAKQARDLLCQSEGKVSWVEYFDQALGIYRAARFSGDTIESCVFIALNKESLPSHRWIVSLFGQDKVSTDDRSYLLSGKPTGEVADQGKIICSCFNVGEATIRDSINEHKLDNVEAIGQCLQAGTNCGSCIPELKAILAES